MHSRVAHDASVFFFNKCKSIISHHIFHISCECSRTMPHNAAFCLLLSYCKMQHIVYMPNPVRVSISFSPFSCATPYVCVFQHIDSSAYCTIPKRKEKKRIPIGWNGRPLLFPMPFFPCDPSLSLSLSAHNLPFSFVREKAFIAKTKYRKIIAIIYYKLHFAAKTRERERANKPSRDRSPDDMHKFMSGWSNPGIKERSIDKWPTSFVCSFVLSSLSDASIQFTSFERLKMTRCLLIKPFSIQFVRLSHFTSRWVVQFITMRVVSSVVRALLLHTKYYYWFFILRKMVIQSTLRCQLSAEIVSTFLSPCLKVEWRNEKEIIITMIETSSLQFDVVFGPSANSSFFFFSSCNCCSHWFRWFLFVFNFDCNTRTLSWRMFSHRQTIDQWSFHRLRLHVSVCVLNTCRLSDQKRVAKKVFYCNFVVASICSSSCCFVA